MIRQFELVERVKAYDPSADEDALNRAYVFAMRAHGSQKRASGDPYFSHPLEVAGVLTSYKLDTASIVTALLHDTIEDTPASLQEIKTIFGDEVANLVDGVTKLTRMEQKSDLSKQAENFRKLLLATSEDIRVLLIKLADRLHNMRTLHFIPSPEKRKRIAKETMEIYAPLAERIGMQEIKDELEDLSFAELNPEARNSIITRLDFLREQGGDVTTKIITALEKLFNENDVTMTIYGREKKPYSIWRKMQKYNVGFEQLADIIAFRVLVDTVEECYKALGVVHSAYSMVPGRFRDYISTPKPNGYRSVHTGVIGPLKQRIEIQIRTQEMHEIADNGVAAHWQYKQGAMAQREGRQYRWVRELLEILDQAASPEDFLENTKLDLFQDQTFCFSPKGELINLPNGATPVDFAYAVHSEVGDHCVGAKINGRIMPLRTTLHNGDQVEILTSKAQTPSPEWERFVATGRARSRIRRFIRLKERDQYVQLGRSIIQKAFKDHGYSYSEKAIEGVIKSFKVPSAEELCADVGRGMHTGREVVVTVYPALRDKAREDDKVIPISKARHRHEGDKGVSIRGLIPGMAMHMAGCCHPLPGDRIVGIIMTGRGVTIHTIDCDMLENYSDAPERWLDVAWETESGPDDIHTGRVMLTVMNEAGSLGELSNLIAKQEGNISNLKITTRSQDFFEILIDIDVRDLRHLSNIIAALRASSVISAVERARG